MPSARKINQFIDQLEPAAARAFRQAVGSITSRAQINALADAIQRQDVDAVFRAAGLSSGAWSDVTEQARRAYIEGGNLVAADAPNRLGFAFDLNNPQAQQWLASHSSDFVTRINADQREAIRAVLAAGFEQGRNPRSIALDIVGRIDRATKRRAGGIVGLTEQMTGYVTNARAQLTLNPALVERAKQRLLESERWRAATAAQLDLKAKQDVLGGYLTRKRRDRRFDRLVQRAIDEGKPLAAADVDRIVGRYSDRLLNLRGENIARTEVLGSLNEGMDQALRQAVEDGLIQPQNIRRVWDATGDSRTRFDHMEAHGQEVGLDEPFIVGGEQMMHPGDFGASPGNVINCRCVVRQQVDWMAEEMTQEPEPVAEAPALSSDEEAMIEQRFQSQGFEFMADESKLQADLERTGFTSGEHKSLLAYTASDYSEVNWHLAGIRESNSLWVPAMVKGVNRSLGKLPASPGVHHRGMMFSTADDQARFLSEFKVGGTWRNKSFMSTSLDPSVASDYAMGSNPSVMFTIRGKTGRNITDLSLARGEAEVLYGTNKQFRVVSVGRSPNKSNLVQIILEEV